MEEFKRWKIVLFAVVLFIVAPVTLYWFVCTPNPWGWGFIKPEDTGAWLGFYGAILGGSLTFGGVLVTIRSQNRETKRLKTLEYTPMLDLYNGSDIYDISTFQYIYKGMVKPKDENNGIQHTFICKFGLINNNQNPCIINEISLKSTNHGIEVINEKIHNVNNIYSNSMQPIILDFEIAVPRLIDIGEINKLSSNKGTLEFNLEILYSNIYDPKCKYKKDIKYKTILSIRQNDSSSCFKIMNTQFEVSDSDSVYACYKNQSWCDELQPPFY